MPHPPKLRCIAFHGDDLLAEGTVLEVAEAAKALVDRDDPERLLVFDAVTSRPVELDLRGSLDDVRRRYRPGEGDPAHEPKRPRGRPKLGVVPKEVTLLPRHWAWLATQPGGASATLRRLVDLARKTSGPDDRVRAAQDATYRFMVVTTGDEPGFEEASRALFAGDRERFEREAERWPSDVRAHCLKLADAAFGPPRSEAS